MERPNQARECPTSEEAPITDNGYPFFPSSMMMYMLYMQRAGQGYPFYGVADPMTLSGAYQIPADYGRN